MNKNPIEISITGKLSYSDEITISQAAQIIAFLNSAQPESAHLGELLLDSSTTKKTSTKKVDNPRDALEASGARPTRRRSSLSAPTFFRTAVRPSKLRTSRRSSVAPVNCAGELPA